MTVTPDAIISLLFTAFTLIAFLLMLQESLALTRLRHRAPGAWPTHLG